MKNSSINKVSNSLNASSVISRRNFIKGAAAVSSLIVMHPYSALAKENFVHLRMMETTDLHMRVHPFNYYINRQDNLVGLARTASLIKQIRNEASNSMLLDNGDFLQGNPMGDYIAYERGMREGDMHPVITAMNTLGYDAATLGNHEFNYGLDFLIKSIAGANFPVVSANVSKSPLGSNPRADKTLIKPYTILKKEVIDGAGNRQYLKIGFIGFVPPQIMKWDEIHLRGKIEARDIVNTAKAWVPEMKELGADIIVALCHSGIWSAKHIEGMEHAAVPLAEVPGIDALLTGHAHMVFPGPRFKGLAALDHKKGTIHGKPAAMGGFWGSHLGLIDLLLEKDGNSWKVTDFSTEARSIYKQDQGKIVATVESAQFVLDSIKREHEETLDYIRRLPMCSGPGVIFQPRCRSLMR